MQEGMFKGAVMVTIGAASYGVLATLVKLAYGEGFSASEVTVAQYVLGFMVISAIALIKKSPKPGKSLPVKLKNVRRRLFMGGTAYGLTGFFYYLSVTSVPVSIAVILLMQTIWMGIVLESLQAKKWPDKDKILAIITILFGTLLATNAISNLNELNYIGVLWGMAAAITYTIALSVSNRIAQAMPVRLKSFWIIFGATSAVLAATSPQILSGFDLSVFWKWGIWLALFGVIVPPILFNTGLPKTGIGMGGILISIEIPVSVGMAYILLGEEVMAIQWFGIVLIIVAVIIINLRTLKKELVHPPEPKPLAGTGTKKSIF